MHDDAENEILLQLKLNNPLAFKTVFKKYYHPVQSNIRKFVTDSHAAEDLLQETFVAFWEKRQTFNDFNHIVRWLFSVSYNKSMSYLKKELNYVNIEITELPALFQLPAQEESYLYGTDQENEFPSHLKLQELNKAIELLPTQKKNAFVLCKIQGLSYQEAATQLNVSEQSIKQYVRTAVASLKRMLNCNETALIFFTLCILMH